MLSIFAHHSHTSVFQRLQPALSHRLLQPHNPVPIVARSLYSATSTITSTTPCTCHQRHTNTSTSISTSTSHPRRHASTSTSTSTSTSSKRADRKPSRSNDKNAAESLRQHLTPEQLEAARKAAAASGPSPEALTTVKRTGLPFDQRVHVSSIPSHRQQFDKLSRDEMLTLLNEWRELRKRPDRDRILDLYKMQVERVEGVDVPDEYESYYEKFRGLPLGELAVMDYFQVQKYNRGELLTPSQQAMEDIQQQKRILYEEAKKRKDPAIVAKEEAERKAEERRKEVERVRNERMATVATVRKQMIEINDLNEDLKQQTEKTHDFIKRMVIADPSLAPMLRNARDRRDVDMIVNSEHWTPIIQEAAPIVRAIRADQIQGYVPDSEDIEALSKLISANPQLSYLLIDDASAGSPSEEEMNAIISLLPESVRPPSPPSLQAIGELPQRQQNTLLELSALLQTQRQRVADTQARVARLSSAICRVYDEHSRWLQAAFSRSEFVTQLANIIADAVHQRQQASLDAITAILDDVLISRSQADEAAQQAYTRAAKLLLETPDLVQTLIKTPYEEDARTIYTQASEQQKKQAETSTETSTSTSTSASTNDPSATATSTSAPSEAAPSTDVKTSTPTSATAQATDATAAASASTATLDNTEIKLAIDDVKNAYDSYNDLLESSSDRILDIAGSDIDILMAALNESEYADVMREMEMTVASARSMREQLERVEPRMSGQVALFGDPDAAPEPPRRPSTKKAKDAAASASSTPSNISSNAASMLMDAAQASGTVANSLQPSDAPQDEEVDEEESAQMEEWLAAEYERVYGVRPPSYDENDPNAEKTWYPTNEPYRTESEKKSRALSDARKRASLRPGDELIDYDYMMDAKENKKYLAEQAPERNIPKLVKKSFLDNADFDFYSPVAAKVVEGMRLRNTADIEDASAADGHKIPPGPEELPHPLEAEEDAFLNDNQDDENPPAPVRYSVVDAFHKRLEKRMTPEELAVLHQIDSTVVDSGNVDTNPYSNIPQAATVKFLKELEQEYLAKNGAKYDRAPKYIEITDDDIIALRKQDMEQDGKLWADPNQWFQYIRQHHPNAIEQVYQDDAGVTRTRYLRPAVTQDEKFSLWNRPNYRRERDLDESWDNPLFDRYAGDETRPELVEAGALEDPNIREQRQPAMLFDPFQQGSRESEVFQQVADEARDAHGQLTRQGIKPYSPSRAAYEARQALLQSPSHQLYEAQRTETTMRLMLDAHDLEAEEQLNRLKDEINEAETGEPMQQPYYDGDRLIDPHEIQWNDDHVNPTMDQYDAAEVAVAWAQQESRTGDIGVLQHDSLEQYQAKMARLEELWNRDMAEMMKNDPYLAQLSNETGQDNSIKEDYDGELDLYSPHALLLSSQPMDFSHKDNRWDKLQDHDHLIKENRQLIQDDYYHDDEIDYEMLERVDPLRIRKHVGPRAKPKDLMLEACAAMYSLHCKDPTVYTPRRLSQIFKIGLKRTYMELKNMASIQYGLKHGLISQETNHSVYGEDEEDLKEPEHYVDMAAYAPDRPSNLPSRPDIRYVDDMELLEIHRLEKLRRERYERKTQRLEREDAERFGRIGPIGTIPKVGPPPPKPLDRRVLGRGNYHLALTDISEIPNARYSIAIRDRNGVLREPSAKEFANIRFREKHQKQPFSYVKYAPAN